MAWTEEQWLSIAQPLQPALVQGEHHPDERPEQQLSPHQEARDDLQSTAQPPFFLTPPTVLGGCRWGN